MFDTIKDILSIGGSGAQLYNMFRDQDNPALEAMMKENEERARLRTIAMNPNSAEFKNYVAVQEEADRSNFAKSMTEALNRTKRAMARGKITTRPERQDEFYSTIGNRLTAGPTAAQGVQNRLLAQAGQPNYAGAVGAYQDNNRFDTLRTDAAIRSGIDVGSKLLDRWKSSTAIPDGYEGIRPGRKPAPSYEVWED